MPLSVSEMAAKLGLTRQGAYVALLRRGIKPVSQGKYGAFLYPDSALQDVRKPLEMFRQSKEKPMAMSAMLVTVADLVKELGVELKPLNDAVKAAKVSPAKVINNDPVFWAEDIPKIKAALPKPEAPVAKKLSAIEELTEAVLMLTEEVGKINKVLVEIKSNQLDMKRQLEKMNFEAHL